MATSLNKLAVLHYNQGQYKAAEPTCVEALAMRRQLLGEDHQDVAQSLNNLAALYCAQGKYEAATPLYVEALAIRKKLLGEAHPIVAQRVPT